MRLAAVIILLAVSAISLSISGCGFRLAGTTNLPQSLQDLNLVITGADRRQNKLIVRRLQSAGVDIRHDSSEDRATLEIELRPVQEGILASDTTEAKTVQRISVGLVYSLISASRERLVDRRELSQQRDFEQNSNLLHASNREKQVVIQELENNLLNLLLRQLRGLSGG